MSNFTPKNDKKKISGPYLKCFPIPQYTLDVAEKRTLRNKVRGIIINSREHNHDGLEKLDACCLVGEQFIWMLLELHDLFATLGKNGDKICNELAGECNCGMTHLWGKPRLIDVDEMESENGPRFILPIHRKGDPQPHYSLNKKENTALRNRVKTIIEYSKTHEHESLDRLNLCCKIGEQFIWMLLELHGLFATLGKNGDKQCNELAGPCACGARHLWGAPRTI